MKFDFIRSGKPAEDSCIEPFSGRFRDEYPNVNQVISLDDARAKRETGRVDYITSNRTARSATCLSPSEYAARSQDIWASEAMDRWP